MSSSANQKASIKSPRQGAASSDLQMLGNDRPLGQPEVERTLEISRPELCLIFALCVLALWPRMLFLLESGFGVESDEAIVGLMAKHIAAGGAIPIFYYGQHYMGSLEAIFASLSFLAFGQSAASLKLVPLIFSLYHIALVYLLARRFLTWQFASIAGLLTAIAPATLLLWSAKARGGFIELVALGTLALILAVDCFEPRGATRTRVFFLGLLLGLGWWVNNQVIFYLLPIALCFAIYFPLRDGFVRSCSAAMWMLGGFALGSWPFWYANIFHEPQFATFAVLFGASAGGNFGAFLWGFVETALPIILGSRRFWSEVDVLPGTTLLQAVLWSLLLCAIVFVRSKGSQNSKFSYAVVFGFALSVPLVFSMSSFGWLSQAPRYLLPLYSVLYVIAAMGLQRIWTTRAYWLTPLLIILLLGANLISGFWSRVAVAGQPFVFLGQRVAEDQSELYAWLSAEGYRHIHTNYWIGYRAAFETDERLTFTRYGHPKTLRIPAYEQRARQEEYPLVYVLVPAEAALLAQELNQFGYSFRKTVVNGYVVLDKVKPRWPRGEQIELQAEQVQVFNRQQQRSNLFDEDVNTRWGSGMPQHPGMELRITLDEAREVSSLELEFGHYTHDAPRDLEIVGVKPDGNEVSLFRLHGSKTYYELQAQATSEVDPLWAIYFQPHKVRTLILRQHGVTAQFDWSIAELRLFESQR